MIHQIPKDTYVEVVHSICEYHKTYHEPNYAGCTCSAKYSLMLGKRLDDQIAEIFFPTAKYKKSLEDLLALINQDVGDHYVQEH